MKRTQFTDTVYNSFKDLSNLEHSRLDTLTTRASVLLSIETLFLGSIFFKLDYIVAAKTIGYGTTLIFFISLAFHLCTFLITFASLSIQRYEYPFNPLKTLREYSENDTTEEEYIRDRLVDLAVAFERNKHVNDTKANLLKWSTRTLSVAFTFTLAYVVLVVFLKEDIRYEKEDKGQETESNNSRTSGRKRNYLRPGY